MLVLLVVLSRLGTTPVTDAVRGTEPGTLALGAGIAVVTTTCAAWRWQVVARRLRVDLRMPAAVAACYRAQFLNATLPGGVLGDLGRGVNHGRSVDDVGRGVRAVAWERTSGQLVLLGLTAAVLLTPSQLGWAPPLHLGIHLPPAVVATLLVVLLTGMGLVIRRARRGPRGVASRRAAGIGRVVADDARALASASTLARIALASVLVVAGHVVTFVVAAGAVGVRAPVGHLVPVALVVLVVGAIPANVGGWGPREGAAAWGFAAAGLTAGDGLAASVAYGAVVLVATVPGAVLLAAGRVRRGVRSRSRHPLGPPRATDVLPEAVPGG